MIKRHLDDVLIMGGSGLLVYGVWVNWPQMVWFAAGAALIGLGVLWGASVGRRE